METQTEITKREYEIIYLMAPESSETDIESQNKKLEEIINNLNGELIKIKTAEKKRLAYPIKRNRNAYSVIAHFNILPTELPNLKKKLDFENNINRYLITKFEKFPEYTKTATPQKPKFSPEISRIKKEEIIERPKSENKQEKEAKLAEIEKKLEEILNE